DAVHRHTQGLLPRGRGRVRHLRDARPVGRDDHRRREHVVHPGPGGRGVRQDRQELQPGLPGQRPQPGDHRLVPQPPGLGRAGGGYRLRVTVTAQANSTFTDEKGTRPNLSQGDSFRQTVAGWGKPPGRTRELEVNGDGKQGKGKARKVEVGEVGRSTAEEQVAVTDAQMEEVIKNQFLVHAGMDAQVSRVKTGGAEPTYTVGVTTTGGSSVGGWPHTVKIFFGSVTLTREASLGFVLWLLEDQLINGLGSGVALLISMIITAFFIPNMLRKGSIDLLVSKPIGRPQLLIYKYIGGPAFLFLLFPVSLGGGGLGVGPRRRWRRAPGFCC